MLSARGRLWNGTFLEVGPMGQEQGWGQGRARAEAHPLPAPQEFLAVTSVELIVHASVSVTSSIKNLVLRDASVQIPVSIYLDPGAAVAGGVPWWVILLAVLAGVLLLALLVAILWKVSGGDGAMAVEILPPGCAVLCCAAPCCATTAMLCHAGCAVPHHAMSCHATQPFRAMPFHRMPCHAAPCHALPPSHSMPRYTAWKDTGGAASMRAQG